MFINIKDGYKKLEGRGYDKISDISKGCRVHIDGSARTGNNVAGMPTFRNQITSMIQE